MDGRWICERFGIFRPGTVAIVYTPFQISLLASGPLCVVSGPDAHVLRRPPGADPVDGIPVGEGSTGVLFFGARWAGGSPEKGFSVVGSSISCWNCLAGEPKIRRVMAVTLRDNN